MKYFLQFFLMSLLVVGCTSVERRPLQRVSGNKLKELQIASQYLKQPVKPSSEILMIDVRTFFDYNMGHFVGAQHLDANGVFESISLNQKEGTDWQKRFLLKLALLGASLDTPIIVIGRGADGEGEEGLVAWALLHVGFQRVQMTGYSGLKLRTTVQVEPVAQNSLTAQNLKPEKRLWLSKADLQSDILSNGQELVAIDVRNPREYLGGQSLIEDAAKLKTHVVNIEWKEFINKSGQIEFGLKDKLESIGITKKKRILVVSDSPSQSATAVTALLAMGYFQVALIN